MLSLSIACKLPAPGRVLPHRQAVSEPGGRVISIHWGQIQHFRPKGTRSSPPMGTRFRYWVILEELSLRINPGCLGHPPKGSCSGLG